jgi:flagella basal body P-ring formation protein FlgA
MVKRVPDVERGADVTLTVQRGGLRIDAPGRLADDGFLGESVRVVNEATKVVAEGLLIAPDRVRIL